MLLGRWQRQCDRGGCAPNRAVSGNAPWSQSASSPTHTQPMVHIVMCSMSLHCSKCMVLSEQETRGQPHSHAGHTHYMQYRKAGRACMIWDTTWVTLEQKGGEKVAFFKLPAGPKIDLRFPCLSIHLSPLFTCAIIMSHTLLPCDLTLVYSVGFDDSGNARMQAATHVMQCLKAKLVLRYEDKTCFKFFCIFATVHVRFIPDTLLFFP